MEKKHCMVDLAWITLFVALAALLTIPQTALSAAVAGGQVQVQEPEVAGQDLQQAQDLDQGEMGAMDVADGADLTLIVPVQIENLHANVDQGKITCSTRRWVGQGEDMIGLTHESRTFTIEDGAYSNTFHFYFSKPADLDLAGEYHYGYYCAVQLNDSTTGDEYHYVWTTQTNADILEGAPPWSVVSPDSNIVASGGLDW